MSHKRPPCTNHVPSGFGTEGLHQSKSKGRGREVPLLKPSLKLSAELRSHIQMMFL